jgi:hypothetical protein
MNTAIELYKDGHREVCHWTESGKFIWTHPEGEPLKDRPCHCQKG